MERKIYCDRSAAVRAARQHCKRIYGPAFEAAEGWDYLISPAPAGDDLDLRFFGEKMIRGPKRLRFTKPSYYYLSEQSRTAEARKAAGLPYA